jgi:hypothetical protein
MGYNYLWTYGMFRKNGWGGNPMARGDQLGRQWRIIQTLLTSKMGKSAADLAEEMEANPRTV